MICDRWDVVVVPFPFVDKLAEKRRPALVLSTEAFNRSGHSVLAMITSALHAPWPGDTLLADLERAGLHVACLVRLKLFTLDNRLIQRRTGNLAAVDRRKTSGNLRKFVL